METIARAKKRDFQSKKNEASLENHPVVLSLVAAAKTLAFPNLISPQRDKKLLSFLAPPFST